jgi:hypothetical protein
MKKQKFWDPVNEWFRRIFEERFGLGRLGSKMIGTSIVIISIFVLGLLLRYTDWWWSLLLWIAVSLFILTRKIFTYWKSWLWQKISNGFKRVLSRLSSNHSREFDRTNKKPFECSNCRKSKHWYEELMDKGYIPLDQKVCTTCGDKSEAVRVVIRWRHPEMETGTDSYLPPGARKAFRDRRSEAFELLHPSQRQSGHVPPPPDYDDAGE